MLDWQSVASVGGSLGLAGQRHQTAKSADRGFGGSVAGIGAVGATPGQCGGGNARLLVCRKRMAMRERPAVQ